MTTFDVTKSWNDLDASFGAVHRATDVIARRDAARAAFAAHGLASGDAAGGITETRPHWLVVCGRDQDDVVIAAAVPLDEISESVAAALREEASRSVAVVFVETSYDAPWQWEIWSRFAVGIGMHPPDAFGPDLETRASEGMTTPTAADLAGWAKGWERYVVVSTRGGGDLARLDVPIAGYTLVREMM